MIHPDVILVDWYTNNAWKKFVVEQRNWRLWLRALSHHVLP